MNRWWRIAAKSARVLVAIVVFVGVVATAPVAAAAPTDCHLKLTATVNPSGVHTIDGRLTDDQDQPVGAASIAVQAGDVGRMAVTDAQGAFTVALTGLKAGRHTVKATTPVSVACPQGADETVSVTIANTVDLTAQTDATSVAPKGLITISGTLTAQSQGAVESALLTIAKSWDADNPISTLTDQNGNYSANVEAPEFGSTTVTVTITFPSDGYLPEASRQLSIAVTDVPSPTPTPTATVSASPSVTPTVQPSGSATPSAAATPGPGLLDGDSKLFLVLLVFVVVAALAVGTLLIIAVVTRQRRGLAADERRGFGSDFGKGLDGDDAEERTIAEGR